MPCLCVIVQVNEDNLSNPPTIIERRKKERYRVRQIEFIFEKTEEEEERARVCALTFTCCNQNNKSVYCAS